MEIEPTQELDSEGVILPVGKEGVMGWSRGNVGADRWWREFINRNKHIAFRRGGANEILNANQSCKSGAFDQV